MARFDLPYSHGQIFQDQIGAERRMGELSGQMAQQPWMMLASAPAQIRARAAERQAQENAQVSADLNALNLELRQAEQVEQQEADALDDRVEEYLAEAINQDDYTINYGAAIENAMRDGEMAAIAALQEREQAEQATRLNAYNLDLKETANLARKVSGMLSPIVNAKPTDRPGLYTQMATEINEFLRANNLPMLEPIEGDEWTEELGKRVEALYLQGLEEGEKAEWLTANQGEELRIIHPGNPREAVRQLQLFAVNTEIGNQEQLNDFWKTYGPRFDPGVLNDVRPFLQNFPVETPDGPSAQATFNQNVAGVLSLYSTPESGATGSRTPSRGSGLVRTELTEDQQMDAVLRDPEVQEVLAGWGLQNLPWRLVKTQLPPEAILDLNERKVMRFPVNDGSFLSGQGGLTEQQHREALQYRDAQLRDNNENIYKTPMLSGDGTFLGLVDRDGAGDWKTWISTTDFGKTKDEKSGAPIDTSDPRWREYFDQWGQPKASALKNKALGLAVNPDSPWHRTWLLEENNFRRKMDIPTVAMEDQAAEIFARWQMGMLEGVPSIQDHPYFKDERYEPTFTPADFHRFMTASPANRDFFLTELLGPRDRVAFEGLNVERWVENFDAEPMLDQRISSSNKEWRDIVKSTLEGMTNSEGQNLWEAWDPELREAFFEFPSPASTGQMMDIIREVSNGLLGFGGARPGLTTVIPPPVVEPPPSSSREIYTGGSGMLAPHLYNLQPRFTEDQSESWRSRMGDLMRPGNPAVRPPQP